MDINKEIKKYETHRAHFKDVLVDEIVFLATNICKKFNKVIDSFHLENNNIYFWFDYSDVEENEPYRITSANDIDNPNDWGLIEEFGINDDKSFKKMCELYNDYRDLLVDENICLERENNFEN